jgi:hypothetical protein
LKENNVAYTIVDEPLLPPDACMHEEWVPRVQKVSQEVEKVYGYFNNHYHGYAAENCIEILEMLTTASPGQTRIKERIIHHNLKQRPLAYERKLEEFPARIAELGVEELLLKLTEKGRLDRAKKITDEELTIERATDRRLEARMRDCVIQMDLKERTLLLESVSPTVPNPL